MPEKLNIRCIFLRHSEYSRNFWTREEAKKARIYPKISTQLSSKCHKWGRGREDFISSAVAFYLQNFGELERMGIHRQQSRLSHKKWAKCNCPLPFLEMLCRGRMPRHHIENPLSIIKAMIAIGRAMGVAVRPTSISLCRRFLSLC